MIIILGLIILIAGPVVGMAGVPGNGGAAHPLAPFLRARLPRHRLGRHVVPVRHVVGAASQERDDLINGPPAERHA
jgi:hypothetical protein